MLERAHRGHDNHSIGRKPGKPALDVEELLRAKICAEAGLGDGVVAEFHRGAGGHDGVAAVRDIGERPSVHESGRALERLHEVGRKRVFEQRAHRAVRFQVAGRDGGAFVGVGHDDAGKAFFQIGDGGGQAKHGHDLGGDRDLEGVLARHALLGAAQAVHDVAQLAVVHVHRALPHDLLGVYAQFVSLLDVVVEHGSQKVCRRADGVEIAGEVQVDVFHGYDLRVPAAGSAALHPKHWS